MRHRILNKWVSERSRGEYQTEFININNDIYISVLNGHIDFPGQWIMNCDAFGIHQRRIDVDSLSEAKRTAIKIIEGKLEKCLGIITAL